MSWISGYQGGCCAASSGSGGGGGTTSVWRRDSQTFATITSGDTMTLTGTPIANSETGTIGMDAMVYGEHYTISGNTVTFLFDFNDPETSANIQFHYEV